MGRTAGTVRLGPASGRLLLRTGRQGLAASVGHDLTLEVRSWSAEALVAEPWTSSRLTARLDLTSVAVVEGTGGVTPLTDADRTEILGNLAKALDLARHPDAAFTSTRVAGTAQRATVDGTLTLHGVEGPLRLDVAVDGTRYRATTTVRQSDFGITPYRAFFGALKLKDDVEVVVEVNGVDPDSGTTR